MKLYTFLALVVLIFAVSTTAKFNTLWPQPKSVEYPGNQFLITPSTFKFEIAGHTSSILNNAIKRYTTLIFRSLNNPTPHSSSLDMYYQKKRVPEPTMLGLSINVKSADTSLEIGVDEWYRLNTSSGNKSSLEANTVYGALRGLETFSQLVDSNFYLTAAIVEDEPRFKYRGFLMDPVRHYYPMNLIYQFLDSMAYAKMNVLHLHLSDDQSWPYESITFPEMSKQGAFSQRHVYTQDDIQNLQRYAKDRGIVVVPEFDTPGHTTRGFEALEPKILTDCYKEGKYIKTGPLNPTLNATFEFLDRFYEEIQEVFWSKYAHIGGDEVLHWCWDNNPEIQAWMKLHPDLKDSKDLEQYFARNLLDILGKRGLSYMVWEEIFTNGAKIQPDTIIEVWKEESWQKVMTEVAKKGFKSVLSAPYYLNLISYGADWKKYYAVEPTDFEGGPEAEPSMLGLEVCMWSEYVDATNLISRTWPRAAAVAERMWSPKTMNNIEEAQVRIHEFRCKLLKRGIGAQPVENGANMTAPAPVPFCDDEWNVNYNPLW